MEITERIAAGGYVTCKSFTQLSVMNHKPVTLSIERISKLHIKKLYETVYVTDYYNFHKLKNCCGVVFVTLIASVSKLKDNTSSLKTDPYRHKMA